MAFEWLFDWFIEILSKPFWVWWCIISMGFTQNLFGRDSSKVISGVVVLHLSMGYLQSLFGCGGALFSMAISQSHFRYSMVILPWNFWIFVISHHSSTGSAEKLQIIVFIVPFCCRFPRAMLYLFIVSFLWQIAPWSSLKDLERRMQALFKWICKWDV